jgi:hypothetical protein
MRLTVGGYCTGDTGAHEETPDDSRPSDRAHEVRVAEVRRKDPVAVRSLPIASRCFHVMYVPGLERLMGIQVWSSSIY